MTNRTGVLVVLAVLAVAPLPFRLHAQQSGPAHRFLLSAEQIRAFLAPASGGGAYVPGQTLVKFRPGAAPSDQTRALSAVRRGTAGAQTRWVGDVLVVSTPANADAGAIATTLSQQPEVEWAQPNYIRRPTLRPNDPAYSGQWNLDLIDMPRAWDINPGGSANLLVAVVDTGVTTVNTSYEFPLWTGGQFESVTVPFATNPDISAARIQAGRDFIFWDGPVLDMVGHGTWVSGAILQETNNNLGAAGIAYRASLLPLKACVGYWEIQFVLAALEEPGFVAPDSGGCSDLALAEAVRYAADAGAQVVNISLSAASPAPILREAVRYAVSRGSFVAMAAGNSFDDGNPVEYPASYAADVEGAMAVGAVGRSSRRAAYSNTGSWIEIVAPGGDFADGGFAGAVTQVAPVLGDIDPTFTSTPRFDRYQLVPGTGTSASAPHVAGVAALLYSQGITNPAAIEAAIRQSATDLGTKGRDPDFGSGLVNARAALRGLGLLK